MFLYKKLAKLFFRALNHRKSRKGVQQCGGGRANTTVYDSGPAHTLFQHSNPSLPQKSHPFQKTFAKKPIVAQFLRCKQGNFKALCRKDGHLEFVS